MPSSSIDFEPVVSGPSDATPKPLSALQKEIHELKEKHNAIILAHNYQIDPIQKIADFTGDSLGLSYQAANTDADVIVNVGADLEVRNAAVNQLGNYDPHAMFIHFDDVDYAGHGYGFSPDVTQYMFAIEQADTHVGAVLAALYARPNYTQEDC